ncbi:mitochondrial proton/calcium exchanger protein-like protein isoform X1, partial [Tanacetum coccineum]
MTRSSTKELFTPFKDPEREFRSSRKHFKTLSLDESRSPDFDLFSDQEEYSEEEVAETMAETMEKYMSKTRADYGSGVARPKIEDKDNFELKGQFLKELCTNTFSGSDHEDANEHIEKVLEIVDLFHIPNITTDQVMLRAFPMSLTGDASRWLRNKPSGLITTWEYLKTKFLSKYYPPARTAKKIEEINNFQQEPDENLYQAWERFKELLMKCPQHYLTEMQEVVLFYNGLDVPTRQILDSRGAIPSKSVADAKVAIQEMAEYSQKWHTGTSWTRSIKTSDGLAAIQEQLNNLRREIKKVNEKVYVAQVGCEQFKGPHYTKDCPLKEEGKTLKEAYYTPFGTLFQRGGYKATAPGLYQRNNTNPSYQERRQSMEENLSKFMGESAKRHEENSNLIKEIRASTDAATRNQGASIKTLEIQIGQMSKVLQERGFGSLPSSTETNSIDHVKSISTIVKVDASSIRRIGSHQYTVSTEQNSALMYETKQMTILFPSCLNDCYCENKKGSYGLQFSKAYSYGASHIDKSIPRKEKDPRSFTLPCYINKVCFNNALADLGASVSVMPLSTYLNLGLGELAHTKLTVELADRAVKYSKEIAKNVLVCIDHFLSTAHAKIDVFKREITLRVGEEKIIFKSIKPASSLIKRVYMLSLRERMELDLEARLMGETLLRRDQVDDLMSTIEEGEVIKEFRSRSDARMVSKFFGYPGDCDHDKKIRIACAHHLKFSCMIDLAEKKSTMLVKYLQSGNL